MSEKVTERMMLDALGRRFRARSQGLGERWIRAEHVRNGTGFYGWSEDRQRCIGPVRTADFVAIDTWESAGHAIHGVEVKVSRSDWLRELADPEKAQAFRPFCDYWWLAIPDIDVVRGDLPAGWGLLVASRQPEWIETDEPWTPVLRAVRRAPRNQDRRPLPFPMQVGLMRAVQKTAGRGDVVA